MPPWTRIGVAGLLTAAAVTVGAARVGAGTADGGVTVRYAVRSSVPERICVGTDSFINVAVVRGVTAVQTNSAVRVGGGLMANMPDVVVDASGGRDGVITLQDTTRVTWLDGQRDPPTARFRFHADKAGTTVIGLRARVSEMANSGSAGSLEDATGDQTITVVNCKFDVTYAGEFRLAGEANLTFGTGFNHVPLEPSADGEYRQSTEIRWSSSTEGVGDCFGTGATRTSEVAMFGRLDADGNLTLEIKFEPFTFSLSANCGGFTTDLTPGALSIVVPVGGSVTPLDQTLTSPLGDVPGRAAVAVQPKDGPP